MKVWDQGDQVRMVDLNGNFAELRDLLEGISSPGLPPLTGLLAVRNAEGKLILLQTPTGALELGTPGVAASVFLDFHSGGFSTDYDSRIIATGGTAVGGSGTLEVRSGTVTVAATISRFPNGHAKMFKTTQGTFENACVQSVIANGGSDPRPQVLGYTPGLAAMAYGHVDSVASYPSNTNRDALVAITR